MGFLVNETWILQTKASVREAFGPLDIDDNGQAGVLNAQARHLGGGGLDPSGSAASGATGGSADIQSLAW